MSGEVLRGLQPDSPEHRVEGHRRAERAIKLLELITSTGPEASHESLEDTETRIELLRSMDTNRFLDILSVSNGLLRGAGFTRWSGEAAKVRVSSVVLGVGLEPPEHAEVPFTEFFEQLKQEITADSKDVWAAKLYIAMVFAHLFSDGNGRLARNAYSFVKGGHAVTRSDLHRAWCWNREILQLRQFLRGTATYAARSAGSAR